MKKFYMARKCEIKLMEENGYIVDYGSLWWSRLSADNQTLIAGYRVFTKNGQFIGLLSEDKAILWNVDKIALYLDGEMQPEVNVCIKDEYKELALAYEKRYVEFLISSLDGLDAYSLKECPKIVAEFHAIERLQPIFPVIIFTEDKAEELRKVWASCDYRKVFANYCGSPVLYGFGKDCLNVLNECRKVVYKNVPWAAFMHEEDQV